MTISEAVSLKTAQNGSKWRQFLKEEIRLAFFRDLYNVTEI